MHSRRISKRFWAICDMENILAKIFQSIIRLCFPANIYCQFLRDHKYLIFFLSKTCIIVITVIIIITLLLVFIFTSLFILQNDGFDCGHYNKWMCTIQGFLIQLLGKQSSPHYHCLPVIYVARTRSTIRSKTLQLTSSLLSAALLIS